MSRLVIVSNRVSLPRERTSRAGGLAVALRDALNRRGGLWFGWSGETVDAPTPKPAIATAGRVRFATLDLSPAEHQAYYLGYANSTLWPLCHYRLGLIEFTRAAYEGYLAVNERFAAALVPLLEPDDIIWVHDYHLFPFASALRKAGVRNRIGFFLHIPFPAPEVLSVLPHYRSLLANLADYDLVGFQTKSDLRAFLAGVAEEADGSVGEDGTFSAFGRRARAGAFPIGIETDEFAALAETAAEAPETKRLKDSLTGRALVIGVDRLDYSKGLPARFDAFRQLLALGPEHIRRVTFLQIAPLSRDDVAQYRTLRRQLESAAGRINGQFAEFDWMPVRYLNRSFPRKTLAGFFRASRIGLVTPFRDGMNLVAKEYVAAQDPVDPGVLILSRFAGAARELKGALIVNPFDTDQVAEALHTGLNMPLDERKARWQGMMQALRANTLSHWRDRFLDALQAAGPAQEAQHAASGASDGKEQKSGNESRETEERESVLPAGAETE
ncbi:MAG TPA: alpha,alpha-trehalose-phosphate synthase (UDP-forming) [Alphaproteobacteria bacterium]|nr:alpha,alpha-trehalose-phosphate synthase (UDP-forming) [Alphaproteobacteria bacterium]